MNLLLAIEAPTGDVGFQKRQKKGGLTMVEEGKKAPDFTLPADDGGKVNLSGLKGQIVFMRGYKFNISY